jgi:magnesium-transporting ATPase (P-type)
MKKAPLVFFNIACIIGILVGLGHFIVPYAFSWYSYIPDAPKEIIQSINYVNFCFSFLLTGLSLLLILMQRRLFGDLRELKAFYVFFVLVWVSRVVIQLLWPWPSPLQRWLVMGFVSELVLAAIPLFPMLELPRKSYKYQGGR